MTARSETNRGAPPRDTPALAEHPSLDEVIAYHEGNLAEAEASRLQDHLLACPECTNRLLDLEAFAAVEPPAPGQPADFEVESFKRMLRQRNRQDRWRTFATVAASLLVASLAVSTWQAIGPSSTADAITPGSGDEAPAAAPAAPAVFSQVRILDVGLGASRSIGSAAPVVAAQPKESLVLLVIHPMTQERQLPRYWVELSSPEQVIVFGGFLEIDSAHTLNLGLPAGLLGPGRYEARLYGPDGERRELIESHAFEVRVGD